MTASEFAFLALGLVLGAAAGAAIIVALRARAPGPREVRVTMAPLSVPTRSVTLAGDPFDPRSNGPAPRGPGDRRSVDRRPDVPAIDDLDAGAPVLRPAFIPVAAMAGGGSRVASASQSLRTGVRFESPGAGRIDEGPGVPRDAVRVAAGPTVVAVADPTAAAADQTRDAGPADPPVVARAAVGVAVADPPAIQILAASPRGPAAGDAARSGSPADTPESGAVAQSRASGPCAELRAIAEERCAVASRARETADAAMSALRDAQRAYDDETRRADESDAIADARAVRTAKESAQQAFRAARERAGSRDELEVAARTWLETINRINLDARDAAARATKARSAANALVTTIERLTAEADGARVGRDVADEACVAARQAVAECEEAETLAAASAVAPAPLAAIEPVSRFPDDEPELTAVQAGEREARVMRLLRGDREALLRTVAELAGDDPAERRRWQIAITGLVDAITAQAIDASIVDVPDQPPFWAPFTAAQRREIVAALASLGHRFDGLGGFADGRVPSQRDLSLALGYAGLDPMRVRRWPTEAEARELLADARVAADEYLVGAAGGFTLSELVDLLGRRADGLTDLWNDWGRVRGRLLATD